MEIKLGFLGFGNVGTGAFKIIQENGEDIYKAQGFSLKVEKILVRDTTKYRNIDSTGLLTDRIQDILDDPQISIVAEFMGGIEPAKDYLLACMDKKKTVVTANKELVARHWTELREAAIRNGVGLYYEASVAGGIPIIKVLGESLQSNMINEIMGIINGTTNFILTNMSDLGRGFEDVLEEAQKLGYAEADPTADVEGFDASYKLSILSSMAFHKRIPFEKIYREGITNISVEDIEYGKELGFSIRLLAICKKRDNKIEVRVHPTFIPIAHPLASVKDSFNAIFINSNAAGNIMLYGRGAGDLPTGSSVVADIIWACHSTDRHRHISFYNDEHKDLIIEENWETEYFVRLTVKDKPGVLAKIAGVFGKYGVSIASVIQKVKKKDVAPLIFVTHMAKEFSLRNAIEEIKNIDDVVNVDNVIRVEGQQ